MFNILKKITKLNPIHIGSKIEYLVVGLGNPGDKYERTRHNAGFIALDLIAKSLGVDFSKSKFDSLFVDTSIENKRVLLIKPQTFMNLSGEAVVQFMNYYKISPEKTIIIFDDISLAPGYIRIKRKGSHGGHNGMRNIIDLSQSDNFPRIKIGIGAKPTDWELADWVTSKFPDEDLKKLAPAMKNTYSALKLILNDKIDEAMNISNRKIN